MSRTAQSNVQLAESRVLSTDATTHIALDAPLAEAAALAESVDIEVIAGEDAEESEPALPPEVPAPLVLTCAADMRVTWGELDEWLERS
jgi:hypothetical protein